jgi:hypothetical protein
MVAVAMDWIFPLVIDLVFGDNLRRSPTTQDKLVVRKSRYLQALAISF